MGRRMATAMAASAAERAVLEEEFRWLLHAEVHAVLRQLQDILKHRPGERDSDSARGCPQPSGCEPEDASEQPVVALGLPGRQAVEAAAANRDESYQFKTGAEVLKLMDAVMLQLTRARSRLTTPATLTLPEIAASGLTRMFAPTLPSDLLVNVYINLNKLCLTVYQLHALQPTSTKIAVFSSYWSSRPF